jgi:predicted ATPase
VDERGQKLKYDLTRDRKRVIINDPSLEEGKRRLEFAVPEKETTRLALGVGFFSPPCVILRSLIEDWRFYSIDPNQARLPSKDTPESALKSGGANLAAILHRLEQQDTPSALDEIVSGLQSVVPGFRGVKTTQLPVEGDWAYQILEERLRGPINPRSASDGTIRLLALMVIAKWATQHSSLISIEEPETGLHPHLSEHIVRIIREASEPRQLIVTTHNPAFLGYLKPSEVILCDKVDGFTQLRRASDVDEIEKFRKHFQLGELWVQGALGAIP